MDRVAALVVLAVVPLVAGGVRGIGARWHGRTLSAAGGIAVAYVFVDLLPKLADGQSKVEGSGLLPFIERHVYLFALVGLVVAFANQRFALAHDAERAALAIVTPAAGGFLVGYSVVGDDPAIRPIALFTIALGLHYLIVDHGVANRYPDAYRRVGRFVVAGAVLLGGGTAAVAALDPAALALVLALIAGGVILETFRHELPNAGTVNFAVFAAATAAYAALLLAVTG